MLCFFMACFYLHCRSFKDSDFVVVLFLIKFKESNSLFQVFFTTSLIIKTFVLM